MRNMIARCLGALKKAVQALKKYYDDDIQNLDGHTPFFPHPRTYDSLSVPTVTHSFKYLPIVEGSEHAPFLQEGKLVFRGQSEDGDIIIIKFARRYSKDAHETCAHLGFAPKLRAFMKIPGNWYMVVMDDISDEYEELDDVWPTATNEARKKFVIEVQEKVKSLHDAGFVHGDIRTTNIMVKKNREAGIHLIDFDWAGRIGTTTYPMNVNRIDINRPIGAIDGSIITVEHDEFMAINLDTKSV